MSGAGNPARLAWVRCGAMEATKMDETETRRLLLRAFRPDDWSDLLAHLSCAQTYQYEPGNPTGEDEARAIAQERSALGGFIATVKYAFQRLAARRIVAHCNPQNAASWRVLERAGFRREGLLRQNIYFRTKPDGGPDWTDTFE
jgi:[ribosomal protein S5]-alanine N-acetyltransferase